MKQVHGLGYGLTERNKMIGVLGTIGLAAAKTLVVSLLTEKMVLKLTLTLLEWAVDRTSNEVDNHLVKMMREQLQKTGVI